ncbi:hypothetical protein IC762_17700 [Bradyrhizobium genosp. L]|uniref:hypothetical protein n=1 Tax=Bradyrhizobium genosp. L TaxID=83637 RepID=UPI0018A3263E|nr:hypothetical protein [Bradyrhizobium genosp. L]QPF81661.1 hypothetical protein IC762_17700 [Bradyrhizobium genosp. L]
MIDIRLSDMLDAHDEDVSAVPISLSDLQKQEAGRTEHAKRAPQGRKAARAGSPERGR